MARTLTADQEEVLGYESQPTIKAVEIDLTTPLYYCTGDRAIVSGPKTFVPRGLTISSIPLGPSKVSRATVRLADQDATLATLWYAERFTGVVVTVYEGIWQNDQDYVITKTVPWICTGARRDSNGNFNISLSGAGGMKPRAGLTVATRGVFPFAPEPGTIIRLYDGQVTVE